MTKQLNEKQQKFLEVLFDEAKGDILTAKKLAGYSENTPTRNIVDTLKDEIADIFAYLLSISNALKIDLTDAFLKKMEKNEVKYPKLNFNGNYKKK